MNSIKDLSWSVIFTWLGLTTIGLIAIYSATQGPVSQFLESNIQNNFFKQLIFVGASLIVIIGIQFISPRTFQEGSYIFYLIGLLLLIFTYFFGPEINGARNWIRIGPFSFQSSEIMKIATILATANYLTSRRDISAENIRSALVAVLIILLPVGLIILQNDFGTALVFIGLIPVMLFWSGLPYGISLFMVSPAIIGYMTILNVYWGVLAALVCTGLIFFIQRRKWLTISSLITGILLVIGIQFAFTEILQPHQVARINVFANPDLDPRGAGWNVYQAKIAIGSGGFAGKGFLEGTQTQLRFLPVQWTDFVYCVIGEEFGFVGTSIVVLLFMFMFIRLLNLAGNHKHPFAQLVIVSITTVFFIHFFINVGSSIALLPVIGIPLPFVSYGGSAFLTNTLMLAICLNMDFYKRQFSIYR